MKIITYLIISILIISSISPAYSKGGGQDGKRPCISAEDGKMYTHGESAHGKTCNDGRWE